MGILFFPFIRISNIRIKYADKKRVLHHYTVAHNPLFCIVISVVMRFLLRDTLPPILAVFVVKIVILEVLLLSKILALIIFYTTIFVKRFWVVFSKFSCYFWFWHLFLSFFMLFVVFLIILTFFVFFIHFAIFLNVSWNPSEKAV